MTTKHTYCNKEREISELYTDMKLIKPIIIGNGKEGLAMTVPKLDKSVNDLHMSVTNLDRNVDKMIRKHDLYEGEKTGKEAIRKRNRWIIGILASVIMGLAGMLVALIIKL